MRLVIQKCFAPKWVCLYRCIFLKLFFFELVISSSWSPHFCWPSCFSVFISTESCTLLHSILLFHPFRWTVISVPVTHNLSSLFYPSDLDFTIIHFRNALQQMSSYTTANRLTLNSFKQNFFSLDSNNLPKCVPTHPLPITMLAILVLFSMNMYLLCPNHSILVFVNLTVLCLDLKTTTTIATSTVHFELLRLALLKSTKFSNNFRLQHIQNSLGHWSCCFQSP